MSAPRSLRFTVGAMLLATPTTIGCQKAHTNAGPVEPPTVNEGPQDPPPDETPPDAPAKQLDVTPTGDQTGGTTDPTPSDKPVVTTVNPGPQMPPKPQPKVMVNPGPTSPPPPAKKPRV